MKEFQRLDESLNVVPLFAGSQRFALNGGGDEEKAVYLDDSSERPKAHDCG